jgi:hypothetical protein
VTLGRGNESSLLSSVGLIAVPAHLWVHLNRFMDGGRGPGGAFLYDATHSVAAVQVVTSAQRAARVTACWISASGSTRLSVTARRSPIDERHAHPGTRQQHGGGRARASCADDHHVVVEIRTPAANRTAHVNVSPVGRRTEGQPEVLPAGAVEAAVRNVSGGRHRVLR